MIKNEPMYSPTSPECSFTSNVIEQSINALQQKDYREVIRHCTNRQESLQNNIDLNIGDNSSSYEPRILESMSEIEQYTRSITSNITFNNRYKIIILFPYQMISFQSQLAHITSEDLKNNFDQVFALNALKPWIFMNLRMHERTGEQSFDYELAFLNMLYEKNIAISKVYLNNCMKKAENILLNLNLHDGAIIKRLALETRYDTISSNFYQYANGKQFGK